MNTMINRIAIERAIANFRGGPGGRDDERQRRAMFARMGRGGGGGGGGRGSGGGGVPMGASVQASEPAARAIARGRAQMTDAQMRARVRNGTATPSEYEDVTGQKYPGQSRPVETAPGREIIDPGGQYIIRGRPPIDGGGIQVGRVPIDGGGIQVGRVPIDGGGRVAAPAPMPPHLRFAPGSENGTKHPDHNTKEYQAWFAERSAWERANYPITGGPAPVGGRNPSTGPVASPKTPVVAVGGRSPPAQTPPRNFVPLSSQQQRTAPVNPIIAVKTPSGVQYSNAPRENTLASDGRMLFTGEGGDYRTINGVLHKNGKPVMTEQILTRAVALARGG